MSAVYKATLENWERSRSALVPMLQALSAAIAEQRTCTEVFYESERPDFFYDKGYEAMQPDAVAKRVAQKESIIRLALNIAEAAKSLEPVEAAVGFAEVTV